MDLLFVLLCGGGLFALNFYFNNGRRDLYALLGVCAGCAVYGKTLHTYLDKLLRRLYNIARVSKEEGKQCLQAKKRR